MAQNNRREGTRGLSGLMLELMFGLRLIVLIVGVNLKDHSSLLQFITQIGFSQFWTSFLHHYYF